MVKDFKLFLVQIDILLFTYCEFWISLLEQFDFASHGLRTGIFHKLYHTINQLYNFLDEIELDSSCVKAFPETVVVCLLLAMKLDSVEARQRFPRLLQIVEQYPDLKGTFISKVCVL